MDSISEEYGVDRAAVGSARSDPVVSVRGLVKRYGIYGGPLRLAADARASTSPQLGMPGSPLVPL